MAGNDKGTQWGFDKFKDFFSKEEKKKGNSELFNNVQNAFAKYEQARSQAVSEQSAMDMISAHQALLSACETYVTERKGAWSLSGKDRLNAVSKLMDFQKQQNLDEIRDLRLVRELMDSNKDKTWEQIGPIRIPEIELKGKTEKVGDVASERLKVEIDGKKGFFTAEKKKHDSKGYLKEMIQQVDEKRNPKLKEALIGNQNTIVSRLGKIGKPKKDGLYDETHLDAADAGTYQVKLYLANAWDTMETGGATKEIQKEKEKAKREFGKVVLADETEFSNAMGIMKSYDKKLKEHGIDPKNAGELQRRKQILEQVINENKEAGEDLKRVLKENKDVLTDLPKLPVGPVYGDRINEFLSMAVKESLIRKKATLDDKDKKRMEQLNLLAHDDKTVGDLLRVQRDAWAAENVANVNDGSELAKRNVATSRMAEFLGLGDMIAHSRKMIVKTDGKAIEGSFMEFAKGIDPADHNDLSVQQKILEIGDDFATPEFNRASSNMAIFDNLCGQGDRHANNLFYQLSEPDANGKRKVLGFQGIDNDISFGTKGVGFGGTGVTYYQDIHFIDKEMAEKLKKLDRNALEFAVGDLLSKEEMDAMEDRMKDLQQRAVSGQMVVLDSDKEWELKEYNVRDYAKNPGRSRLEDISEIDLNKPGLDERGKSYLKGLLHIEGSQYRDVAHFKHCCVQRNIHDIKYNAQKVIERKAAELSNEQQMNRQGGPVREKVGRIGLMDPAQRRGFNSAGKKAPEPPARTNNRFLGERNSQAQTANTEQKQSERGPMIGRR